jgi:hypothetical protein
MAGFRGYWLNYRAQLAGKQVEAQEPLPHSWRRIMVGLAPLALPRSH